MCISQKPLKCFNAMLHQKLVRIDPSLVQLFFEADHSELEPSQPFRLMLLQHRIGFDESLL